MLGRLVCSVAVLVGFLSAGLRGETPVRIATYNIEFLSAEDKNCGFTNVTDIRDQGNRLIHLIEVIVRLDANIIGLQEIMDRQALELVFNPAEWHIVIDDDSGDCQDVALVVRKPLKVLGFTGGNLNAGDDNFLFEDESNTFFPRKRDLLCVEVEIPGRTKPLAVMVHHAKSRSGGRATTEHRRVGAAEKILSVLESQFDEKDYVLLGDFNDNPDDRSLNILEAGNPSVLGGPEEIAGPFLINLTEPLCVAGHVSFGRTANDIVGDKVNTIDSGSRDRNNGTRGQDRHTGDILFDQILVPPQVHALHVMDSTKVFDHKVAMETMSASDHLPVYADFLFDEDVADDGPSPTPTAAVVIVALLPNPKDDDRGREGVELQNTTDSAVDLADGWVLKDRAGNQFNLTGTIDPNSTRTITMGTFSMPLNNNGDEVRLLHGTAQIHSVSYSGDDVEEDVWIRFD